MKDLTFICDQQKCILDVLRDLRKRRATANAIGLDVALIESYNSAIIKLDQKFRALEAQKK